MIPEPWVFALLALAAFRLWKLVADDDILDRPRAWALARLSDKIDLLIQCPWCLGLHLSVGIYLCWIWLPTPTLVVCTAFALSAAVGLIAEIFLAER